MKLQVPDPTRSGFHSSSFSNKLDLQKYMKMRNIVDPLPDTEMIADQLPKSNPPMAQPYKNSTRSTCKIIFQFTETKFLLEKRK
jgi:hypothetical protein